MAAKGWVAPWRTDSPCDSVAVPCLISSPPAEHARSATASSTPSRPAIFPQTHPALSQPALGRAHRASARSPTQQWIAHFGRFEPLPGSFAQPLALRYHGHQFQIYNPDLGDGRGFLFAQLDDDATAGCSISAPRARAGRRGRAAATAG